MRFFPVAGCFAALRCAALPQDVSGGKPVMLQGTDLPLWGLEIDPEEVSHRHPTNLLGPHQPPKTAELLLLVVRPLLPPRQVGVERGGGGRPCQSLACCACACSGRPAHARPSRAAHLRVPRVVVWGRPGAPAIPHPLAFPPCAPPSPPRPRRRPPLPTRALAGAAGGASLLAAPLGISALPWLRPLSTTTTRHSPDQARGCRPVPALHPPTCPVLSLQKSSGHHHGSS